MASRLNKDYSEARAGGESTKWSDAGAPADRCHATAGSGAAGGMNQNEYVSAAPQFKRWHLISEMREMTFQSVSAKREKRLWAKPRLTP